MGGALGGGCPLQPGAVGQGPLQGGVRELLGSPLSCRPAPRGLGSVMAEAGSEEPQAPPWHPRLQKGGSSGPHHVLGGQGSQNRPGQAAAEVSSVSAAAAGPGCRQSAARWLLSKASSACRVGLWKARAGEVRGWADAPSGGVA